MSFNSPRRLPFLLAAAAAAPALAQDNGLVLYGAGSLREAMTEMARPSLVSGASPCAPSSARRGACASVSRRATRSTCSPRPTSAMPAKLVADGRASVMAMFARNELCLLSPSVRAPAGPAGVLGALLADGVEDRRLTGAHRSAGRLHGAVLRPRRQGEAGQRPDPARTRCRARQPTGRTALAQRRLLSRRLARRPHRPCDRLLLGQGTLCPARSRIGHDALSAGAGDRPAVRARGHEGRRSRGIAACPVDPVAARPKILAANGSSR